MVIISSDLPFGNETNKTFDFLILVVFGNKVCSGMVTHRVQNLVNAESWYSVHCIQMYPWFQIRIEGMGIFHHFLICIFLLALWFVKGENPAFGRIREDAGSYRDRQRAPQRRYLSGEREIFLRRMVMNLQIITRETNTINVSIREK
jgi:hypothetical protein